MPKIHIYLLIIIFVLDFTVLSSKPSLIYRDCGLITGAGVEDSTAVKFARSFLGFSALRILVVMLALVQ